MIRVAAMKLTTDKGAATNVLAANLVPGFLYTDCDGDLVLTIKNEDGGVSVVVLEGTSVPWILDDPKQCEPYAVFDGKATLENT